MPLKDDERIAAGVVLRDMVEETGWTRNPTAYGVYWMRLDGEDKPFFMPVHVLVDGLSVYHEGKAYPRPTPEGFTDRKFLGPISPSDAEQLIQLRKAATNAVKLIDEGYGSMAIQLLRAALNPDLPKET